MIEYLYDSQEVKDFVSEGLHGLDFGLSTTIGIRSHNRLICGVVYNNYIESPSGTPVSIEMTIYSTTPKWCTHTSLRKFFAYPFLQLGVKRVQATSSKSNIKTHRFLERLGFTYEGIGRDAWPLGGDCVIYSMLNHECKWLHYG